MFVLQSADFQRLLRRKRDSNPRNLSVQRFSRPPQSTTLPSLLVSKTGAKVDGLFELYKYFVSFLFTFLTHYSSITDFQTYKKRHFSTYRKNIPRSSLFHTFTIEYVYFCFFFKRKLCATIGKSSKSKTSFSFSAKRTPSSSITEFTCIS